MSLAVPGFLYSAAPARVLFGQGRSKMLHAELGHLGVTRVLVACTSSGEARYREVIAALGASCASVFAQAQPHCRNPSPRPRLTPSLRGALTVSSPSAAVRPSASAR